ncbi:MAG: XTP/dITP diphosphatase [Bacillota bacterium]
MRKLVLATRNAGKEHELKALLAGLPLEVVSLRNYPDVPELVEDGDTFAANAAAKARQAAAFTGEMALADDSGLEVDALAGRPGVHSARFAGPRANDADRNAKLLEMLEGVPTERRTARFKAAMAVAWPGGGCGLPGLLEVEEACEGLITEAPRGDGGHGFDPVFLYGPAGRTFAEMTIDEKNEVSHRGRAARTIRGLLLARTRS